MKTELLTTEKQGLTRAAELLLAGEVVAFPTETVYGLGANALDDCAVQKIFAAKNRPADNPLIVHVSDIESAANVVEAIPPLARAIMEQFWPGPISIILNAKPHISAYVTAGLNSVAVRCPDHPVALALLREVGIPIAAPSANISGRPSGTEVAHVQRDFNGRIAAIIDGGACTVGLESTVVDARTSILHILRPGAVTEEMLAAIGQVVKGSSHNAPVNLSPGTRYPHYHPIARVILIEGESLSDIVSRFKQFAALKPHAAVMGVAEVVQDCLNEKRVVGSWDDLTAYAENLYGFFRWSDDVGIREVIVHGVPEVGLGRALMNRLRKAADEVIGGH